MEIATRESHRVILSLREVYPRNILCVLTKALVLLAVLSTERSFRALGALLRYSGHFTLVYQGELQSPVEYSSGIQGFDTTGLSTSIAKCYITSQYPTLDSRMYRPHDGRWMITEYQVHPKRPGRQAEDAAVRNTDKRLISFPTPRSES